MLEKRKLQIFKFRTFFLNNNYLLFLKLDIIISNLEIINNNIIFINKNLKKYFFNKINILFSNQFVKLLLNNNLIYYFNDFNNFLNNFNIINSFFITSICFL